MALGSDNSGTDGCMIAAGKTKCGVQHQKVVRVGVLAKHHDLTTISRSLHTDAAQRSMTLQKKK